MRENAKTARENLLHECEGLLSRLQECSINLIKEDEHDFVVDSSSLADALHLLTTSDDQIGLLLTEVPIMCFSIVVFAFIVCAFSIFGVSGADLSIWCTMRSLRAKN